MRKKSIYLGLVLVTALSSSTIVMADTITGSNGTASKDVMAQYEAASSADKVYKVDVTWGSMEFIYNAGETQKIWNPVTHTYTEVQTNPEWVYADGANEIRVTNSSNAKLTATITPEINTGYNTIKAASTPNSLTLEDASTGVPMDGTGGPGTADIKTAVITLEGALAETNANKTAIGSVKVTIEDAV